MHAATETDSATPRGRILRSRVTISWVLVVRSQGWAVNLPAVPGKREARHPLRPRRMRWPQRGPAELPVTITVTPADLG